MHKRLWNALRLEFIILPKGPLLVKSGLLSPNPALPDMQFVRTATSRGEEVFIPGSSLKGVFRSFTEKVLRTVGGLQACDPFNDNACGRRLSDEEETAKVYRSSCHACKIYGNTRLRGRLGFQDVYPDGEIRTETRYGVAISRLTNAVAHGPFEMEVVVGGRFKGALLLENFEVWQLGLLALTMRAINNGLVRVGFGKNRGFGGAKLQVTKATLNLAKTSNPVPSTELWGIGTFVRDSEEQGRYGLKEDDRLTRLPEGEQTDQAIFTRRIYDAEAWQKVAEKALESLPERLGVEG
jgi:CRISPR-associated RAMP protein (TIGR02581 family)